jgi:hypothetical protein
MDYALIDTWMTEYIKAWRAGDPALLEQVFSEQFSYKTSPFKEGITDWDTLREFWQETCDKEDVFTLSYDVVAIEGDIAVLRVDVHYTAPDERYYKDLWIVQIDDNGLCFAFEEWPIKAEPSSDKWY